MKYKSMKIVSAFSEEHSFEVIQDLRINTDNGIIEVIQAESNFIMLFDRLRHFEVIFASPQQAEVRYSRGLVTLKDDTQSIVMKNVINFEWKVDQGLFMIFGKDSTLGVHLDHLVSFRMEN